MSTNLRTVSSPSSQARAVFRQRAGAIAAILLLLAAIAYSASQAPRVLAAGALDHFTITVEPISPAATYEAGAPFRVTVTAYDADGVETDYDGSGAELSGLADSPNGDPPDYGSLVWGSGDGRWQCRHDGVQSGPRPSGDYHIVRGRGLDPRGL